MANAINWFEIPVKNFDKAKESDETILGSEMQPMEAMGMKIAFSQPTWKTDQLVDASFKITVIHHLIQGRWFTSMVGKI